ncbi:hypothetical protein ABPG75_013424 [Micractinium tetrahymenae]
MASLEERLAEAQQTGPLNLSYLGSPAAVDEAVAALAVAPHSLRIAELDISSNGLDALPAGLGAALPRLRALRAKYNRFAALPTDALGALQLEALDLEGNQIAALDDHVLPALGPQLRRLNLAANGLAALPDSVARCRGLEALTLSNNPLTALPEALAGCPITHLDVSSCRLTALPPALATCRTLQRLFCQNNDLPRVPTALGHLPNLKEWDLRANRLPLKYEQARERGLAKFLAFLREEEEIERLQEIERNRPVGIASGPCMIFRCKTVLDDAVAASRAGDPVDGFAWIRSGHAVVAHRNQLLVFGGVVVKDGRKTAEVLVLNTDTMGWRVQPTRGDRPCPRDGHVLVVDPSGGAGAGQLILFGGRNAGGRRLNDLHVLDLATWTWFVPRQEGAALPAPREQAAAVFSPDGRLLLFGGRTNGERLNDLWSWDAESGLWEQLPSHGTAPSPRQGAAACVAAGQLFIMGGSSNFVLHDVAAYSLEAQEWRALSIEVKSKAAARAGGHIITWQPGPEAEGQGLEGDAAGCGSLWMFGGRDALGAQVSYLLKLKPRNEGAWYEWVETEFSMLPNRSRITLFDSSARLNIAQCGHPLHKLNVSADQIEKGSCIWDVVQMVPLANIKEKEVRPEDLVAANPKRERIKHATLIAGKLPLAFRSHTPREQQLLAAAAAFKQRWAAGGGAGRLLPPVTLLNECGVEKAVCTTLRWASLPHTELHDLADITQFVSEFFAYEPLEDPTQLPTHLVSPWSLLEWQAGDSFDLATLACSLLLGAGYNAYVVVGYTSKQVALCDQSRTECPWLAEHGLEPPPYAELPEEEPSFEELEGEAGEESGEGAWAAAAQSGITHAGPDAAEPSAAAKGSSPPQTGKAAKGSSPPQTGKRKAKAGSRPATSAAKKAAELEGAAGSTAPADDRPASDAAAAETRAQPPADELQQQAPEASPLPPAPPPPRRRHKRYVHTFVLVKPGRCEVAHAVLLDPGTGRVYGMDDAPCSGVECAWNDRNFWVSLQTDSSSGDGSGGGSGLAELGMTDWGFSNPNCWLPLLLSREEERVETATINTHLSLHSSKASEALLRSASTLPARVLSSLSSHKGTAGGASPRTHAPLCGTTGGSGSGGLPRAASVAAGAVPPGGVALQHLAMGARSGTPRLSVYAPTRELADSSLTFLSPEETAAAQQRSSLLPACSTAALLPTASSMGPGGLPTIPSSGAPSAIPVAHSGAGSALGAAAAPAPAATMPAPPEMPPSWVPPLSISRERLDMRCPRGQKVVAYRQARRELYARYGECGRWDGLVERLTTYDGTSSAPLCVLELFSRRRDKLVRRLARPGQRATLSIYEPFAQGCLKSVRLVRGVGAQRQTEFTFYSEHRADGLLRRRRAGNTMEEWFLPGSRPDGLIRRTVVYLAAADSQGAAAAARAASSLGMAAKPGSSAGAARPGGPGPHRRRSSVVVGMDLGEQAVASIHEEYSRSQEVAAGAPAGSAAAAAADAAEGQQLVARSFDLHSGEMELVTLPAMAIGEDGAEEAPVTRTYDADGQLLADEEDAAAAASLPAEQQLQGHVALVAACRAAQAAVLAAEEESRALLQFTQRQEQGDVLVTPHYDATRIKVEDSDGGDAAAEEDPDLFYDFLQHFLQHTGARDLTAGEAEEAGAACLAAFDDRQTDRHRLLSLRLAECGAELARLRGIDLAHLSPADQERFKADEAAAAFRLRVVQRRLQEHAPAAAERRAELAARLAADRRLAAALAAA